MMHKYIEVATAAEKIAEKHNIPLHELVDTFSEIPAADVVEVDVVRCKDCKHWVNAHDDGLMYCMRPIVNDDYAETGYMYPLEVDTKDSDFCSYGERRR